MGDNKLATAFQGEGQSQNKPAVPAATGQTAGENAAQPQYVTLEQATKLAQDAAEEAFRRAQSLYSKGQAGFEKRVQADLKNLEKALDLQKKAGVTITPEQENSMRQQVINQAFMEDGQNTGQPNQGTAPAQAPEGEEVPNNPIEATAWQMMRDAGIDIYDEDPEFALVDQETENAYAFLKSIETAIEAKRQRLAGSPAGQQQTRLPTNAGASGQPTNNYAGRKGIDLLTEWSRGSG